MSNGEDYEDMVLFAQTHKEFLKGYVSLPNGIPAHDTFRRVFSMPEPEVLRGCLRDYGKDLRHIVGKANLFRREKTPRRITNRRGNKGL